LLRVITGEAPGSIQFGFVADGTDMPPCRGKYNTLYVNDVIDVFVDEDINGLISSN
jgi:hypothetical protein